MHRNNKQILVLNTGARIAPVTQPQFAPPAPPIPPKDHMMNSSSLPRPYLPFGSSDPETESIRSFNPKRVSQAAARPLPPRPKLMAPYVHLDFQHQPVDRRQQSAYVKVSKTTVKAVRIGSIVLRVFQLFGALGLLVCMLLVRKIDDTTGWICRAPPAIAVFHIVYSIYHLSGSYRSRTPSSTVGYYLFASSIDIATVAFYSFAAVLSWKQRTLGFDMEWATIFASIDSDQKVVMTVFLTAVITGGLTLVSLCFAIYLIHTFRRLASASPEMNPFLEPKCSLTRKPAKRFSSSSIVTARTIPFAETRHPGPVDVPSPRESMRFSFPQSSSAASPRSSVMSESPRYSAVSLGDSPRNSHDTQRYPLIDERTGSPRRKKQKSYAPLKVKNSPKQKSGLRDARATSATSATLGMGLDTTDSEWRYRKPSGDAKH